MANKLTPEEIIEALERISQYSGFTDDVSNTLLSALDLINRQQAEIERLEKELSIATNHITRLENQIERLLPMLKTKRTEAIKEFAEKLKKRFYLCAGRCVVDVYHIDNLVKEMVGEE